MTQLSKNVALMAAFCLLMAVDISAKETFEILVQSSYSYDLPKACVDHSFPATYVVANTERSSKLQPLASVVRFIGPEPNTTKSQCWLPYFKRAFMVYPMITLNRTTVLIPIKAKEDGQEEIKYMIINTDTCKSDYIYNGNLPRKHFVLPIGSLQLNFTIILHGKKYCQANQWCRLFFNPFYYKTEPLDFDFLPWQVVNISPASSLNGNERIVVDHVGHNDTRSIRLYNITANNQMKHRFQELISLENNLGLLEIKSSSLSFCWESRPLETIIRCAAFHDDGEILLERTIIYPIGVFPLHVQSIPNGLALIVSPSRSDKDIISVTLIRKIDDDSDLLDIKHREYHVNCFPPFSLPFRMHVYSDSIQIDYPCKEITNVTVYTIFDNSI